MAGAAPNVFGANQGPQQLGGGCKGPRGRQGEGGGGGGSAALRGGRRAAECVAWQLEQVPWVTLIKSHVMAREGAGGWFFQAWLGGVLDVMGLRLCASFQVFVYFKSCNLILCLQVHCGGGGGGHEGCFAKDLSFVFVWGLCFSPCRTWAVPLLELLEEE